MSNGINKLSKQQNKINLDPNILNYILNMTDTNTNSAPPLTQLEL